MQENNRYLFVTAVLLFTAFIFLVGCGRMGISSTTAAPSATKPAENVEQEISATATLSETDVPPLETSTPDEDKPAVGVAVETDRITYDSDQEIVVSATNNLDSPITTIDQQGFCSIFRIEEREGNAWTELINCFSGPPPTDFTIAPGETVTTTFPPQLEPGTYRVELVYTEGDEYIAGSTISVYSMPFEVR